MKKFFILPALLMVFIPIVFSESLYSPTWGFKIDLPEGYDYIDGDGRDRFTFSGPFNLMFSIIVYNDVYNNLNDLADDINRRLGNNGNADFFTYNEKQAAIIELNFDANNGWGLCFELQNKTMLLALSYGQPDDSLILFHLSALDSIVPSEAERYYPGAIMEYSHPRGEQKQTALFLEGISAMIHENDADAAQALIEREFNLLLYYFNTPLFNQAWIRYYRAIYRDSYSRAAQAVSALAQHWGSMRVNNDETRLAFAQDALSFVQGFHYERNFAGSDFLNLVTAVTQGRGDCDSRAMLWALILAQADIRAAMMVSLQYSHAMGLAGIEGEGARFEAYETAWLVAETTANIGIGLIAQDKSDPANWLGIIFE